MSNVSNRSTKKNTDNDKYDVNKKSLIVMFFLLFLLMVLVIGVSYQVYLYTTEGKSLINEVLGEDNNIFLNGSVTVNYTEANGISIVDAIPINDENGKRLSKDNQVFDFIVSVNMNKVPKAYKVAYEVVAEKDNKSSTIDEKYVKLYLERSDQNSKNVFQPVIFKGLEKEDLYGAPKGSMVLDRVVTSESITNNYRLRMWLDSSYPLSSNKETFKMKVNVYATGDKADKFSLE